MVRERRSVSCNRVVKRVCVEVVCCDMRCKMGDLPFVQFQANPVLKQSPDFTRCTPTKFNRKITQP